MVRLFRVKPATRMAVKVAMIEHGMATAATKAGRSFLTERKKTMVTTMAAPVTLIRSSGLPQTKATLTAATMATSTALSHHRSRPMKRPR